MNTCEQVDWNERFLGRAKTRFSGSKLRHSLLEATSIGGRVRKGFGAADKQVTRETELTTIDHSCSRAVEISLEGAPNTEENERKVFRPALRIERGTEGGLQLAVESLY